MDVVEIDNDDQLYRRLIIRDHINPDGSVNSAAFKGRNWKPDPHISVDLAKLTTPEKCLAYPGRPGFSVGMLVARVPRSLGFTVRHAPEPDNYAHSLIEGNNERKKCRLLAEATTVILRGPDDTG